MLNQISQSILQPPAVKDDVQPYKVRLLYQSLLTLVIAHFVVPIALLNEANTTDLIAAAGIWLGMVVALIILRYGRYTVASIFLMLNMVVGFTAYALAQETGLQSPPSFGFVLIVVFANLLLDRNLATLFTFLTVTSMALVAYEVPTVGLAGWMIRSAVIVVCSLLLRYTFNILQESLRTAQASNEELRQLGQKQENLVRDRTKELELAAQVGNEIARLRDVQELLQKTVDAVRTRFGLYHVQIYLADAAGRTLSLQAGTGVVGRELVGQSHRLPIGPNSINGTAAARKEAIIVTDTRKSPLFRANPLLPDTRSEMAIPLIVNERVLGVLNLQSAEVNGLSEGSLVAFQLLGSQIAIAVENANLFTQVTRTQEELMAQARRLTKNNWEAYLPHVDDNANLSYSFSMEEVTPISDESHATIHDAIYNVPIKVIGQPVGYIQVAGGTDIRWNDEDAELVQAVASQVAQQLENLRLLQESERYRSEAETVLQRLTQEGWQSFLQKVEDMPTYLSFDSTQVTNQALPSTSKLSQMPLTVRGRAIGELLVDTSHISSNDDRELIASVAGRLSTHLESLRLTRQNDLALAESRQRSEELQLINRIVTAVTAESDLSASLLRVANELSQVLQVERVGIALLNSDQTMLTVAAESNTDNSNTGIPIPVKGNASTEEVLRTRQTLLIEDAQNDPLTAPVHELFRSQNIQSIAIIPLIVGNEIIGTVGIAMLTGEGTLSREQISLAETLVRQTGTAVQNLRLVQQTQKRAQELGLLNRVAEAVASQLDSTQLMETIFTQVSELLQVDSFYVGLYDPSTVSMGYPFYHENHKTVTIPASYLPPHSQSYKVISSGQPVLIHETPQNVVTFDFEENEFFDGDKEAAPDPTQSCIFVPLRQGNQVVGIMSAQSQRPHAYTEEDVNLLMGVANYFTIALQNADLFAQTQKRAEQLGALNRVAEAVASQLDVSQLIHTIYEQVANAMAADTFQIALYDAAAETIEYPLVVDDGEFSIPAQPLNPATKAYQVIQSGQPLTYSEVPDDSVTIVPGEQTIIPASATPNPITQSAIFVPMRRGTRTVGVISVQNYKKNAYTVEDLNLLTGIANYFTVALQNASLFAQTQKRVGQLDAINHVAQALSQQLEQTQLLETIANQVQNIIPYDTFYVGFYEKADNTMRFPAFYEDGQTRSAPQIQVAPHSYTRRILDERRPILVNQEKAEMPAIVPTGISEQAIAERITLLFVPLLVGMDVIGVMSVQSKVKNAYSEDDMTLLSGIASYFTVAWQNANLYAQTRKRAERERLVNEITQQIQRTVSVESALQTAAHALGRALQTAQTEISLSANPPAN